MVVSSATDYFRSISFHAYRDGTASSSVPVWMALPTPYGYSQEGCVFVDDLRAASRKEVHVKATQSLSSETECGTASECSHSQQTALSHSWFLHLTGAWTICPRLVSNSGGTTHQPS